MTMSSIFVIDKTNSEDRNLEWKIFTGKRIVKYACLCITLLLLIISASMLFLKITPEGRHFYYDMFIGHHFGILLSLYPVIEGLILALAVYGIFAILTEKKSFVRLYGILLFLAFALNAAISGTMVATTIYKIPETYTKLFGLMEIYEKDFEAENTVNFIQNDRFCCGYYGPSDWRDQLNVNENRNYRDFVAPKSCCNDMNCMSYNNKGCGQTIKLILLEVLAEILVISSTLSILFLLAVICTFILKRKIGDAENTSIFPKVLVGTNMKPEPKSVVEESKKPLYDNSPKIQEFSNFLYQNSAMPRSQNII